MASKHNPSESYLQPYTSGYLFSNRKVWFVDDTCVYRFTKDQNPAGIVTTPINGAIFILNPQTGQFFLRIVHTSDWVGEDGLVQLATQRAIEQVFALINSLPVGERPNELLITSYGTLNSTGMNLPEFVNIEINDNHLRVPFQAFTEVSKFENVINEAIGSEMHVFNLYDDWLESTSSCDAFARLILILRALHENKNRTNVILKPHENTVTEPHHTWPTLTHAQWIQVRVKLEDLVPAD